MSNKNEKRAFTLVELLVVVAIIALLVSILLPALGQAREQAKKVVCLNNCHQWALAVVIYTAENDDEFPVRRARTDGSYWQGWPSEYYGAVSNPDNPYLDLMNSFITNYIQDQKDFICPSLKHNANDPRVYVWEEQITRWQRVRGDYSLFIGYDMSALSSTLRWGASTAIPPLHETLDNPYEVPTKMSVAKSRMAVVGDAVFYLSSINAWRYSSHPFKEDPSADVYSPAGMCAGFVDGSAAWVDMDDCVPFFQNISDGSAYFWPDPKK